MIPLICTAIGGCLATACAMAPFGPVTAALTAPFGGSLCAAIVAFHQAGPRSPARPMPVDGELTLET